MLDVEQKNVSSIESGKNYPTIDRLERIAAALNVPLMGFFDFLYLEDDDESAANIEAMLKELDKNSRKIAYSLIRATIKALKDV